ncbi:MAG: DUF3368 domain-containing protein [Candidatus Nanohaloarchaeota archaeon QJJ-7]|nr:DUF3368 domain-containing protein [Candidatus Nanohaloarchaeota archaeon QJJ-7]
MLVLDATPLIYLAKAGVLQKLESLEEDLIVPNEVYDEVVIKGKEAGEADALLIENLAEAEVIEVREVKGGEFYQKLESDRYLSDADRQVLSIAEESGISVVDEEHARSVADMEGVENRGTVYLLFRLLDLGVMDAGEARETLESMIEAGWYCSTDLYSKILRELEEHDN